MLSVLTGVLLVLTVNHGPVRLDSDFGHWIKWIWVMGQSAGTSLNHLQMQFGEATAEKATDVRLFDSG